MPSMNEVEGAPQSPYEQFQLEIFEPGKVVSLVMPRIMENFENGKINQEEYNDLVFWIQDIEHFRLKLAADISETRFKPSLVIGWINSAYEKNCLSEQQHQELLNLVKKTSHAPREVQRW